jgi:hypothetical protein
MRKYYATLVLIYRQNSGNNLVNGEAFAIN